MVFMCDKDKLLGNRFYASFKVSALIKMHKKDKKEKKFY